MITNLSCNYMCKFCYQVKKNDKVLQIPILVDSIKDFPDHHFEYCTIMGGESTMLPNLHEYIEVVSRVSPFVRLTTNGYLLTNNTLLEYKESGLTGINVSVASLAHYQEVTQGPLDSYGIRNRINLCKEHFPNQTRINIALCKENMSGEIKDLIHYFLCDVGVNVTICEDILATYSLVNNPEKMGARFVEDTGYGLLFFEHEGRRFGYYHHSDNYKNTDLIVSPLGNYIAWDKFCEDVGINYEN